MIEMNVTSQLIITLEDMTSAVDVTLEQGCNDDVCDNLKSQINGSGDHIGQTSNMCLVTHVLRL